MCVFNQSIPLSIEESINRKYAVCNNASFDIIKQCSFSYYNDLKSQCFKCIVFDYDLTIHNKYYNLEIEKEIFETINSLLENGIKIGIATGNGQYIANEIKQYIIPKYWGEIIIGYYNGGLLLPLNIETRFESLNYKIPIDFKKIIKFIELNIPKDELCIEGIEERNPFQLNFYSKKSTSSYVDILKHFIRKQTNLKIMQSPHSFDVIPRWVSKSNVCNYFRNMGINECEILTMGDSGAYGENDFELLNRKFSLSVNTVSNSLDYCWNYSPPNLRELAATLNYLKRIDLAQKGIFLFKI